ncbi:ABC1 family-domain-containing protein [Ochromonadaceae sp. CCMP2298]|nr:ABC1 family-domain-containing protein [Ochromonadaceae sp. CCMP2298]
MSPQPPHPQAERRPIRMSVYSVFSVFTVFAVLCLYTAHALNPVRRVMPSTSTGMGGIGGMGGMGMGARPSLALGSTINRKPQSTLGDVDPKPIKKDMSIGDISSQIKDLRASLAGDEKTTLMLDALRGRNVNDDDQQLKGVDMKVVTMRAGTDPSDTLPTVYNPVLLEAYFAKRPFAVLTRIWQVASASVGVVTSLAADYLIGNTEDMEVRRAAELRNTIVSLGPFFIKLGQALSIRPDILSPRAMVELQQLCDKVPCFDSALAMRTIEAELGVPVSELFSAITEEPVAAASLGQVYKATLRETGEEVAVKVQRPYVLETVSLDLHLVRQAGLFLRNFPDISSRLDIVKILDEFAGNFYQELDYNLECANGIRIAEDMKRLPMVLIPRNYPKYTNRRVHTAEWIEGEKLSQSTADDVGNLVNLGVITYLTQLLDTGFFHADPHPGNMLRSPDGRLVILDFGLMTQITDNQKYGMIEAIAHLIHRDYDQIGKDFQNLDFIPEGVDTTPIIPALARYHTIL